MAAGEAEWERERESALAQKLAMQAEVSLDGREMKGESGEAWGGAGRAKEGGRKG